MNEFMLRGGFYEEIYETLSVWKILSVPKLYDLLSPTIGKRAFRKKISKMEKGGMLLKKKGPRKNENLVHPTSKAIKNVLQDKSYEIQPEKYMHEYVLTMAVEDLMKAELMKTFNITSERRVEGRFNPDATLTGVWGDKQFNLAFELELHQKEAAKVRKKVNYYIESSEVHRAIYCFGKFSTWKAYYKILSSMDVELDGSNELVRKAGNRATDHIILLYEPNIWTGEFNIYNSNCYYKGKNTSLAEIFNLKEV